MRQRNIAKRTKSIEVAVGGSVESQYLIGAASPRGHSMSSHSSRRGVERQSSRCAGRTRTAAESSSFIDTVVLGRGKQPLAVLVGDLLGDVAGQLGQPVLDRLHGLGQRFPA